MPWCNRRQALPVETGDQLGDRITSTPPSSMRRVSVVLAICYGQQRFGPGDMAGRFAGRTTDLRQHCSLFVRQGTRAGRFCGGSSCTPDCSTDPQFTKATLLWQGSCQVTH